MIFGTHRILRKFDTKNCCVNINVSHKLIQCRVMKHLYCAVCKGTGKSKHQFVQRIVVRTSPLMQCYLPITPHLHLPVVRQGAPQLNEQL